MQFSWPCNAHIAWVDPGAPPKELCCLRLSRFAVQGEALVTDWVFLVPVPPLLSEILADTFSALCVGFSFFPLFLFLV